jgi:hypothetical protein
MEGIIYAKYANGLLTFDYCLLKVRPDIRLVASVNNTIHHSQILNNNTGVHSITMPWSYDLENTYLCTGIWGNYDFKLISCMHFLYYTEIKEELRNAIYNSYIKIYKFPQMERVN